MGGVRPYEFRANSSCLERTQLSEKKESDSLSRQRRLNRSWQFLQRSRRSMRIFRRSKTLRQSRSIFEMRFLLDTNIVSDLVRHPRGRIFDRISEVGEEDVCTSIVVAAELRYGATKKKSSRLTSQLEAVLGAIEVLALEEPVDALSGVIKAGLEQIGQPIGANDLLIAAHGLTLDLTVVTDNEREFLRIEDLRVENWLR